MRQAGEEWLPGRRIHHCGEKTAEEGRRQVILAGQAASIDDMGGSVSEPEAAQHLAYCHGTGVVTGGAAEIAAEAAEQAFGEEIVAVHIGETGYAGKGDRLALSENLQLAAARTLRRPDGRSSGYSIAIQIFEKLRRAAEFGLLIGAAEDLWLLVHTGLIFRPEGVIERPL